MNSAEIDHVGSLIPCEFPKKGVELTNNKGSSAPFIIDSLVVKYLRLSGLKLNKTILAAQSLQMV